MKVQFHWDRSGRTDDTSSCWLRVVQGWAGGGFGMQFTPRVGAEVVVGFLDGDPDQPLVIGGVHNAGKTLPYALPANKTRSTVKSRSSPNGAATAANELRFEDKTDAEEVYLRAQKDFKLEVLNDLTETITHDRTTTIDNNQTLTVKQARKITVAEGNDTLTVSKGTRSVTVKGNETHTNSGKFTHDVTGDYALTVGGNMTIKVDGKLTIEAASVQFDSTSGSITVDAASTLTLKAGSDLKATAGANFTASGSAGAKLTTSGSLTVQGGMATFKAEFHGYDQRRGDADGEGRHGEDQLMPIGARLPVLMRPGLSARAEAALAQAVLLASVPATVRHAVPDTVLAGFGPPRQPSALQNPWAAGAALPAPPATRDPRGRAVATVIGLTPPAPPPSPPSAQPAPPNEAQRRLQAAKDRLGEAAAALLADGQLEAADALDQARVAAARLVMPMRRSTAEAPAVGSFTSADAVLARLQAGAGTAGLHDGLATLRQALTHLADDPMAEPVAAPIAALATRRAALPTPRLVAKPRATPPPRRIPALPAIPVPVESPATTRTDPWGVRAPLPARPLAEPPSEEPRFAAPYDTLTAGALSGIAAACGLMRRNGLGGLGDPGALDRLAAAIEHDNATTDDLPPWDAEDHQRLMQWCGLARQASLLRTRFGLVPWDRDQQPALAAALRQRGHWLAERLPWPGRAAAADGLEQWLPLVDCAEALDLPLRGDHALRNLGRALRHTASRNLPRPRDMVGLARTLATEDAMAILRETTGLDPASEAGAARLMAMARGLESLPDLPPADIEGAVDTTTFARLRRIDHSQAGDLDLQDLTTSEIPLLSRGLPVLAALDARRRYRWPTAKG